jgi:hypothetical protein
MNELHKYANIFANIRPWAGLVPKGYLVDFLGTLTDANFRTMFGVNPASVGGTQVQTRVPVIEDGEGWFEAVNWVEAAREARERFVMVTLGACYGAQAVGSYRALQALNPMPCRLVAVEPEPENYQWTRKHMSDNGIDPDAHCLLPMAISGQNQPVLFPIGSPGSGAQNCFSTNESKSREGYAREIIATGRVEEALRNLLINNTTGLTKDLVPGPNRMSDRRIIRLIRKWLKVGAPKEGAATVSASGTGQGAMSSNFMAEIKLVSAVTLQDVLSPFDFVDYVESDIQQSEIVVFPPYLDLLRRKVRRVHIGTHGIEVHRALHRLFEQDGWDLVFSFEPNGKHNCALGSFETNDGVLTVRNPVF